MISKHLSEMASAIAPAVANHLWQSTLFAILAALLTLPLRKNHARARYWLWLAASLKFLVPLSLLIVLGSHLPRSRASAETQAGLYSAMQQVSQQFIESTLPVISPLAPATDSKTVTLPVFLIAAWLCGFVMVLCIWCVRWSRLSRAIQEAVPLRQGRELQALRRIECITGTQQRIRLLSSRTSFEPGIFGIADPVLVWPEGISERLDDAHLEAILVHELWHVRRRDNLASAMHMMVEALFWFHPVVWWLGARMVEERERACDEEVLESGSDRHIYAESILKICEFCVESPLACVSGVTGADLKRRIVRIMTEDVAHKLDFSRKLLLSAAGLVAVTLPLAYGLLHATQSRAALQTQETSPTAPAFEVASIKPDKDATGMFSFGWFSLGTFTTTGATVQFLIQETYGVQDDQIMGAPKWLKSDRYDIKAKVPSTVVEELRKLDYDQSNIVCFQMLRALLTDRFKLTLHKESKELPMYALVVAKNGPKLHEAIPGDTYPDGIKDLDGKGHGNVMDMTRGHLVGQGISIADLVNMLSHQDLGLPVIDKTGLTGKYDFTLKWTLEENRSGAMLTEGGQPGNGNTSLLESSGPSLDTALEQQLGLKLERRKGPVDVLVIDHVEKPSEN